MTAHDPHIDPDGCGGNAAPYVLGALTDEEHASFRRHLESCSVCREEVAALQVVASALPAAAPQLSAPPQLKRRVMAGVREDARRGGAHGAERRADDGRARVYLPMRGLRAAALARLQWRPNLAAATLAAAVVALAIVALASGGGGGGGGTRVSRAIVSPRGASASLSVSNGHAQLNIADMPQAAPGRVYELWLKRSASAQPQPTDALFTVAADGAASVGVPGNVSGVREVLVTSEPLGGSLVPTRPPVIIARVA
jgi:anti-sigma-K factor RskA